jgi:hypothetical protein
MQLASEADQLQFAIKWVTHTRFGVSMIYDNRRARFPSASRIPLSTSPNARAW